MLAATAIPISAAAAPPQQPPAQAIPRTASAPSATHSTAPSPSWLPWSDTVFAQAQRENRFVLLDLEAVWCHWCHVMDQTTYRDQSIALF